MELNPNGIIIQDIQDAAECQKTEPYYGVGRYSSWPLSRLTDSVSRNLTQEAEEKWFGYYQGDSFTLAVVPEVDYVRRYVTACQDKAIQIRILFIETDREEPTWLSEVPIGSLLGYDFATSQDFFSALYDDLYGSTTHSSFNGIKAIINNYGLVNELEDLLAYIDIRNSLIREGYDLEPHGDFCVFRISLLDSTLSAKK